MNDQDKAQQDKDIERMIQTAHAEKDRLLLKSFRQFLVICEEKKIDPVLTLRDYMEYIKRMGTKPT